VLPSETPNEQTATLSTPDPARTDTKEALDSVNAVDSCPVPEVCIDEYLWSLYQRTPNPKAAEKTDMPLMEYVIGGIGPQFQAEAVSCSSCYGRGWTRAGHNKRIP
jgi:hypothetical protein